MNKAFYVTIPQVTFGIESEDGIITSTHQNLKWMVGKSLEQVLPWLLQNKAKVIELTDLVIIEEENR